MFIRNCSECNIEILHKTQKGMEHSKKLGLLCKKCSRKKVCWSNIILKDEFTRDCPKCNNEIIYTTKSSYTFATKNNSLCKTCNYKERNMGQFERNCPICKKALKYSTLTAYKSAMKYNSICISCSNKIKLIKNKEIKTITRDNITTFKYSCSNCNKEIMYYNKNDLLSSQRNGAICTRCATDLLQYIKNLSRQCKKCGNDISYKNKKMLLLGIMKNTSCSGCVAKEVSSRYEIKKIRSINVSGENNPMFGRAPANNNWGWGWSGRYKQYNFRSLLELHYILYLINNNINFKSAEKLEYAVDYIYKGKNRKYFPDFYLIDINKIIEIKPNYYFNDEYVLTKINAAIEKYGKDKYEVISEKDIVFSDKNILAQEYIIGNLIFNSKYDKKFRDKYLK